ncbi:MAG: xanthine dehydrogenase family protein subunit M [Acidimicrobiia bacterium]
MSSPASPPTVVLPATLDDALRALERDPALTVLAGGTDLMVAVNYGRLRPTSVLSLRRVAELRTWRTLDDGRLWLGAGLTYRRLQDPDLAGPLPALAQAARTVGSPQIRNSGTLGGNLGTASPAGDTLPVLASLGAEVELASADGGVRRLPLVDGDDPFITGPKRTALRPGELVAGVIVPTAAGPQEFLKIGTRNAMVISVASCALVVDTAARSLRCTLGSVGPIPMRCPDAEAWIGERLDWPATTGGRPVLTDPADADGFGERCAAAARPIDDHRSTAAYRRHACAVLARRALRRAAG